MQGTVGGGPRGYLQIQRGSQTHSEINVIGEKKADSDGWNKKTIKDFGITEKEILSFKTLGKDSEGIYPFHLKTKALT